MDIIRFRRGQAGLEWGLNPMTGGFINGENGEHRHMEEKTIQRQSDAPTSPGRSWTTGKPPGAGGGV